jgi:putative transcriptional regulator
MTADSASINLTHHFLIAMPGLEDAMFSKSVVYVCEHSERGALGLVINKPSDMRMQELFEKVNLPLHREDLVNTPVLSGGPVHTERGFVLHDAMQVPAEPQSGIDAPVDPESPFGPAYASTMVMPDGLEMTTSKDVLEALSGGAGPRRVLISLGYAAWGQGQLESELAENSWLTVAADPRVIFETPIEQRYEQALGLLGLSAWMLSSDSGHA